MVTRLNVELTRTVDESYPLLIGTDLAGELPGVLEAAGLGRSRVAVITDNTVNELIGAQVMDVLSRAYRGANGAGVSGTGANGANANDAAQTQTAQSRAPQLFVFPAGEENKTRATKEQLEDAMLAAGFNRDTVVVALGGGVVSDLAGFVAATFTRGVPYITMTTTLVGAADAAIGGKTAVDTPAATNLIGAFHQPRAVLIDVARWATLTDSQLRDGMGETVKHACLADRAFFETLEEHFVQRGRGVREMVGDTELSGYIARRNAEIKVDVVQSDVHEGNRRMALNLGHTIGRALEAALDYALPHGECVAIGLNLQCRLGLRYGYLTAEDAQRVDTLLRAIGLPTELPAGVSVADIMRAMGHDKKSLGGAIRFVFQRGIGAMETFAGGSYAREIPTAEVREFLEAQPRQELAF
ncbi:3-dehydroquinate synthase [Actinotignum sp. GS-2025a]|uniref:3-dehydroquinate synthase n=1 Tax=Actinotignum sp. GS-2025a TaxID=3427274 RepID=UPI003F4754F2